MTNPNTLIAAGSKAVEAELARIAADFESAKTKAVADTAAIGKAIQAHLDIHAGEVASAQALLEKAQAVAGAAIVNAEHNIVPAVVLTKASTKLADVKNWFTGNGWKAGVLVGIGLVVIHYVLGKIF